jgi:hypothetical protein
MIQNNVAKNLFHHIWFLVTDSRWPIHVVITVAALLVIKNSLLDSDIIVQWSSTYMLIYVYGQLKKY